jgi:hypothetical protein
MSDEPTSPSAGSKPTKPRSTSRKTPQREVRPPRRTGFGERDPMGKMALFSEIEPKEPTIGWLWLECSSCLKETPVTPLDLVKLSLPFSLHFPFLRPYHSLMRCPACGRRTWVRVKARR